MCRMVAVRKRRDAYRVRETGVAGGHLRSATVQPAQSGPPIQNICSCYIFNSMSAIFRPTRIERVVDGMMKKETFRIGILFHY